MLCILLYSPFSLVSLVVLSDCTVFFLSSFFYFPFTLFFARRWPFVCFSTSILPHFYFYLSVRCSFCLIGCTNIRASFIHHWYSTIRRSIKSLWPLLSFYTHSYLPTYLPFQALFTLILRHLYETSFSSPGWYLLLLTSCVTFLA